MSDLTAKRPRATPGTARLFVESRGALPQGPLRRHAGRYNKMGRGRPRLEEQRRPPKPPGDVKSKAIRAAETAKRLAALFAELQEAKRIDRIFTVATAALALAKGRKGAQRRAILEVRERAERKGGQLLLKMLERGEIGRECGRQSFASLGVDTDVRLRWTAAAEPTDEEFEAKLAWKAAAAARPPCQTVKMHITSWYVDAADGLLTRQIFAEDGPSEAHQPGQRP